MMDKICASKTIFPDDKPKAKALATSLQKSMRVSTRVNTGQVEQTHALDALCPGQDTHFKPWVLSFSSPLKPQRDEVSEVPMQQLT